MRNIFINLPNHVPETENCLIVPQEAFSGRLLASILLFQPPEQWESEPRERKRQFVSNVGALVANQSCNRSSVPCHFHSQYCPNKSKAKCGNSTLTEGEQVWFVPSIEIVPFPGS